MTIDQKDVQFLTGENSQRWYMAPGRIKTLAHLYPCDEKVSLCGNVVRDDTFVRADVKEEIYEKYPLVCKKCLVRAYYNHYQKKGMS